ncbi:MAG: hypothetical protein AB7I27_18415 [Bacteriovoracaceae bacterium]
MKILLILFLIFSHLPGFGLEDDEKVVSDLVEKQVKQLKLLEKVPRKINKAPPSFEESLKHLKKTVAESRFDQLTPHEVKSLILSQMKDHPIQKVFETFPKILDISIDILRDKKALIGLIEILEDRDSLWNFTLIWVTLFALGIILRKLLTNRRWGFFPKFCVRLCVSLILTSLSLYIFYQMFQKQLDPTLIILRSYF